MDRCDDLIIYNNKKKERLQVVCNTRNKIYRDRKRPNWYAILEIKIEIERKI
jgi:predicted ABC-type ATPase